MNTPSTEVVVLGTAQDGGVPQTGCDCEGCRIAAGDDAMRRLVSSIGIIDRQVNRFWLVDASPDIGAQLRLVSNRAFGCSLAGILLTHAHIGHYLGLAFLGKEAWNTREMPVWCTDRMASFLETNQPWRQLIDRGNILLNRVEPSRPVPLSPNVAATPTAVPHRDEFSDTVAWSLSGHAKSLVYCPDIDRWEGEIMDVVSRADIALLDGTFYSADELPGRDLALIPHPLIVDSVERLADLKAEVCFLHLNHSNPLFQRQELRERLRAKGFGVAERGDAWPLSSWVSS